MAEFFGLLTHMDKSGFSSSTAPLLCSRVPRDGSNSDFIGTEADEVLGRVLRKWACGVGGLMAGRFRDNLHWM